MKRNSWLWLGVLAVVIVAASVWWKKRPSSAKELDASLITTCKRGDLAIEVVETGKVQPREKVELKSKVAGQVERVLVEEGAVVKKGQALMRLDPTDYRREVARTEADVAQAKNGLEFAKLTLDRKKRGLEARGVAQADVDLAENEVKVRTVALRTAEVALSAAQDRLQYTQISSPIDGTVIQRGIQPGEVVTPGVQATFEGKPLLTIADLSTLIVKVDLNQIDVARVKLEQTVALTLDALPGSKYEARVTKISPASTTVKGRDVEVFPVEATLKTVDARIKPGMTADVRVHIETKKNVLTLPIEALLKETGKYYATRVITGPDGAQKLDKVAVEIGARNDREMEVTSGIKEGERILIKPASSAENEYKM